MLLYRASIESKSLFIAIAATPFHGVTAIIALSIDSPVRLFTACHYIDDGNNVANSHLTISIDICANYSVSIYRYARCDISDSYNIASSHLTVAVHVALR